MRLVNFISLSSLLILTSLFPVFGQGAQVDAALASTNNVLPQPDGQLQINRETLYRGLNEKIRIQAAILMLNSDDPAARSILLEVLKQRENTIAVAAVCKALSLARTREAIVLYKMDFLEPLVGVLTVADPLLGALVSEACLFYPYEVVGPALEAMASDNQQSIQARLNALDALRLQPDKQAAIKLLILADDPEAQVAQKARQNLEELGFPVGHDQATRQVIITTLGRKSQDAFLRDWWVLPQEKRIQKERLVSDVWRKLYLDSLNQLYSLITDDQKRGSFIAEHLEAPQTERRLWALGKADEWRMGSGTNLPSELTPVLIERIDDPDRLVRLRTAQLLSKMGPSGAGRRLLEHLEIESDAQVRTEMFVALGMACEYALLQGSSSVSSEVKRKTLGWAETFLAEPDPKRAKEGADVIRKLLQRNGLDDEYVQNALQQLRDRFLQDDVAANPLLRADLLKAMAGLCQPRSVHRILASSFYRPLFDEARRDPDDRVRLHAIEGLLAIDRVAALAQLRSEQPNDSNTAIRLLLVEAAADVGGVVDLEWLLIKLVAGQDAEPAWQAVLAIAARLDAEVLDLWLNRILAHETNLSDEQAIALLQVSERKSMGNERKPMMRRVLRSQADRYRAKGDSGAAAKALVKLLDVTPVGQQGGINAELVGLYLATHQIELAVPLVQAAVKAGDVGPTDDLAQVIEAHLALEQGGQNVQEVATLLDQVKVTQPRPSWEKLKSNWLVRAGRQERKLPPDTTNSEG